ncbi:hypothetical protein ACS3SW_19745 [Roseobacteraceae bacterium S113]
METTSQPLDEEALLSLAQRALDETGRALETGDFERFRVWFCYPYIVETFEDDIEVVDEAGLRALFDRARAFYANQQIVQILRTPLSVSRRDEKTVVCTYETLLLPAFGAPDRAPYCAIAEAEFVNGGWRYTKSCYAIADSPEHNQTLLGAQRSGQENTL